MRAKPKSTLRGHVVSAAEQLIRPDRNEHGFHPRDLNAWLDSSRRVNSGVRRQFFVEAMTKAKETKVYIFKVALTDAKRIWRRIAIRGDQTLEKLHWAIFEAFDRDDPHLYSFFFPKPGACGRARLRDAAEYTHPYVLEDNPFDDRELYNAATTKIGELKLEKGQIFDYLFDFGDSWEHIITVEETDGRVERGRYPRILEKRGESPPQYPELDEVEEE